MGRDGRADVKDGTGSARTPVGWPDAGRTPARQIELIRTFADQAVIAIENVAARRDQGRRLRQTATAEILKVIASSPYYVQPVFDAITASSKRLLGGHDGGLALPGRSHAPGRFTRMMT